VSEYRAALDRNLATKIDQTRRAVFDELISNADGPEAVSDLAGDYLPEVLTLRDEVSASEIFGDISYAYVRAGRLDDALAYIPFVLGNDDYGPTDGDDPVATAFLRRQWVLLALWLGSSHGVMKDAIRMLQAEAEDSFRHSANQSAAVAADRERVSAAVRLNAATTDPVDPDEITSAREAFARLMVDWLPTARWLGGMVDSPQRFFIPRIPSELEGSKVIDRLDVQDDARALAALVASRAMEPPLAIGIYGKWGSGKTFLMRLIEQQINEFERSKEPGAKEVFEQGIAHIRFSAWHYVDANLWASLLGEIFEKLSRTPSLHEQQLQSAMEKIQGAERSRTEAHQRLEEAKKAVRRAHTAFDAAKTKFTNAVGDAAKVRAADVFRAITSDKELDELKDDLNGASRDLGLNDVGTGARDLLDRADEVAKLASQARALATAGPWWRSPLVLGVISFIAVTGIVLIFTHIAGWANWKSPAAAAVAQFTALCSATATWIGRQSAIGRRLLAPADAIQRNVNKRVEAAKAKNQTKLVHAETKAAAADLEVTACNERLAEAETQLANARSDNDSFSGTALLERYLSERATSGDYQRHQGLIALAHRDLKNLSDFLTGAKTDAAQSSPLRRIVLYIDDLDRCPPGIVMQVLEAVHLLLGLPLFAVIVGVDPDWLYASLRQTNEELFVSGQTTAQPHDYLEKIFHLTYRMPVLTSRTSEQLLTGALSDLISTTETVVIRDQQRQQQISETSTPARASTGDSGQTIPESRADKINRTIEALTLTPTEILSVNEVAPLVSTTPRRVKRFLSIYLVVRAKALAGNRRITENDQRGLLLMVAIQMAAPSVIDDLIAQADLNDDVTIAKWVEDLMKAEAQPSDLPRLLTFVELSSTLRDVGIWAVSQWLTFVQAFVPPDA
jgi:hypothetical protein